MKEPQPRRPGEQLLLRVGRTRGRYDANCYAWGHMYSWEAALESARSRAEVNDAQIFLIGRIRQNDYVGPPIWGEYVDYGPIPTEDDAEEEDDGWDEADRRYKRRPAPYLHRPL